MLFWKNVVFHYLSFPNPKELELLIKQQQIKEEKKEQEKVKKEEKKKININSIDDLKSILNDICVHEKNKMI